MKEKILNETKTTCNNCLRKEWCIEKECVVYRIEQIVLNDKEEDYESNQSNRENN